MSYLRELVTNRVAELGVEKAAQFFGVSELLARQWAAGSKPVSLQAVEKVFVAPETGFETAAWDGKQVMLMLPWYKSTNPLTAFCLLALFDRAKMGASMEFGDAFIAHARNKLLDTFYDSKIEWGMFIDDDMILPCGNAGWFKRYTGLNMPDHFAGKHTINQLMSHQRTLVSGLYFQRKDGGLPVYSSALYDTPEGRAEAASMASTCPKEGLKQVDWAGTGCLLIHRSVLTDIREKMPHLAPKAAGENWHYCSSATDTVLGGLPEIVADLEAGKADGSVSKKLRRLLDSSGPLGAGEDMTFGLRAKECGHPTFVDTSIVCGHIGGKVFGNKK